MNTPQDPAPPRISVLAVIALALAMLSFVFSILAGIPAIILASVALYHIQNNPNRLAGTGYAKWAVNLSVVGSILTLGFILLMPQHHHGENANRSACAANIKGILVSMQYYANENNNVLPLGAPPKTLFTYTTDFNINTAETSPKDALQFMQSPAMAGQALSPLWILVLTQQVSPKSFICQDDPFSHGYPVASAMNDREQYFATFQKPSQISYSIAYPWARDEQTGQIGPAPSWRLTNDDTIPLMTDMAPLNGTGKPPRNVERADLADDSPRHTYFGFNHVERIGDGANTGFADAHAEWNRSPKVGQNQDNIFTSGGAPTRPAKAPSPGRVEPITTTQSPFDTVMIPLRDGNTGAIK